MNLNMYFFDIIGGHYSAQGVRKLVKINRYTTFMHFLYISTPQKLKMNTFLVVLIYGGFWEIMNLYMYFFDTIRGHYSALGVQKLVKMTRYLTFEPLFVHFYTTKVGNEYIFWQYYFMEAFGRTFFLFVCYLVYFMRVKKMVTCCLILYFFATLHNSFFLQNKVNKMYKIQPTIDISGHFTI